MNPNHKRQPSPEDLMTRLLPDQPPKAEIITQPGQPAPAEATNRLKNFENFAQSVSCLLTSPKPNATEREALLSLVRQSFPEFLEAKKSLSRTQSEQTKQVQELGPLLLDKASKAVESDEPEHIDETARIMWELAKIDEQIEDLMKAINLLKRQILTWVKWDDPANARAVNWALENA
jgi:hypothetical protein